MQAVPLPLRSRLGEDATIALVDTFESEKQEMLSLAAERFDRRLSEELSALRVEFHQGLAALRCEVGDVRVELLKWSFLFWVGQVAAMAALLAFMLRR